MTPDNIKHEAPAKVTTRQEGDRGEDLACDYMRRRGCIVVDRNWKSGHYEIDIICQKDDRLIFVEVKKRTSSTIDPVSAVTPAKQRRLIRAADSYLRLQEHPFEYQFDIIAISGSGANVSIEHIEDAFFPSPR